MIDIKELIDNPSKLNAETLKPLREMVETYPFFQVARLLYVANLYKMHSESFGKELRKASLFVPDRRALFALTEGEEYQIPDESTPESRIETESDANRTISLIDGFLSGQSDNDTNGIHRDTPTYTDLTQDYASFLIAREDTDGQTEEKQPKLKGEELINSFISKTKGKHRFEIADDNGEDNFVSPELSDEEEEIYTENMVNIYIQQGRYSQALEILNKICLNNPKKSSNFAAQIKLLEVITQ